MVAINAYTWVTHSTGTVPYTLQGTMLNWPLQYLSAMVNKGITGANISTGGIDAGALIAANIITQGHLNFAANGGVKCAQIGKSTLYTGQLMCKGTAAVASNTTVSNTVVTVYFTNGDGCTAGDTFRAGTIPHVYATVIYATPTTAPTLTVTTAASGGAQINVKAWTSQMTEPLTVRWLAVGDV
jgi:hypothetical protein